MARIKVDSITLAFPFETSVSQSQMTAVESHWISSAKRERVCSIEKEGHIISAIATHMRMTTTPPRGGSRWLFAPAPHSGHHRKRDDALSLFFQFQFIILPFCCWWWWCGEREISSRQTDRDDILTARVSFQVAVSLVNIISSTSLEWLWWMPPASFLTRTNAH